MAKSTKSGGKKSADGGATGKKAKAEKSGGAAPALDTALAAQTAARLLAAGMSGKAPESSPASRGESAMFKQLKSGMAKPAGQAMSNLLDKHGGPLGKAGHEHVGGNKAQQIGRNQTFGADVNRAGVPRRTGGG